MMVSSLNFALKSNEEQGAIIYQFQEFLTGQRKLAVALGIGQETEHIWNRNALLAYSAAGAAHPAIRTADAGQLIGQQLLVFFCVRLGHGTQVLFELLVMDNDIRHLLTSGADSVKKALRSPLLDVIIVQMDHL
jgi:hypothetical protein